MGTALLDRRDLDFLLFDWLGIEALFARPHYAEHSRDTVAAVLDLSERLAADAFLPALRASDRSEPALTADGVALAPEVTAAVRDYIDAGLLAGPFGQDVGGLQLPQLLHYASIGQFMAASLAVAAYPMLTIANARLLAAFGNAAQVEAFALPQIRGQALGTMCLSEPQAGSSLADIRTLALPDGEDALGARHRLHGNKMWISAGDHDITGDIVHLVLARTPGADGKPLPGIKGISLFVVPKHLPDGQANDIAVAGLNHKMGYRGTSNCLLNFGEGRHAPDGAGGAIGWRIGEAGEGLAQMFHMMNEARTGVGLGAAAAGCRGHLLSVEYARGRVQGRTAEGGTTRPAAIIEHADVKHMLLAQKAYAEGALALVLYAARLLDDQLSGDAGTAADAGRLLDLLTPVVKAWPSEYGLAANDLAIQIHGGYGYTRDYDVEQLYRDNRLNPIHARRRLRRRAAARAGRGDRGRQRRRRPARSARAPARGHLAEARRGGGGTGLGASAAGAGTGHLLPARLRPRRGRLAVAGHGPPVRRGHRVPPRQARRGALVLRPRTAPRRALAGPGRHARRPDRLNHPRLFPLLRNST